MGLLADPDDQAANQTAGELAEQLDAEVTRELRNIDVLVVGSRSEGRPGYVTISARAQNAIEESIAPVLIVARAVPSDSRCGSWRRCFDGDLGRYWPKNLHGLPQGRIRWLSPNSCHR